MKIIFVKAENPSPRESLCQTGNNFMILNGTLIWLININIAGLKPIFLKSSLYYSGWLVARPGWKNNLSWCIQFIIFNLLQFIIQDGLLHHVGGRGKSTTESLYLWIWQVSFDSIIIIGIIVVIIIIIIIILFFISFNNIFCRQVIGWGVQPREPGDEREGFRWVINILLLPIKMKWPQFWGWKVNQIVPNISISFKLIKVFISSQNILPPHLT